jgi:hypothetical protein
MTDTTAHDTITPGPWTAEYTADPDGGLWGHWYILSPATEDRDPYIASMFNRTDMTTDANARAIAALPALIDAVRCLSDYIQHNHDAWDGDQLPEEWYDARAALAQLKGPDHD